MAKTATNYQLKITLLGIKPPVWRRLLVPSSVTLKKLHQILQITLGWTDSHLHEFRAGRRTYGTPQSEYPNDPINEARVRLNEVLLKEKASMLYEYDFGDGWEHKILLEKIVPHTPGLSAPSCIGGVRACPPEDCGGVGGYETLLEAIADPSHPEHEDMLEWVGGEFAPEYFDRYEVNEELKARIRGL